MKKTLLTLAAVFAATLAFAQTELLTNGGFEKWTGGQPDDWKSTTTASSGTLTQTTDVHNGTYAVVLTNTTANQRMASKELKLKAGTYTFSAYVKSSSADAAASARLGYTPVTGGKVGSYSFATAVTDLNAEWRQLQYEFTLASATMVNLVVMTPKSTSNVTYANLVIDDASLTTADGGLDDDEPGPGPGDPTEGAITIAQAQAADAGATCKVVGTVVALCRNGALFGDETGYIYYYKSGLSDLAVGDKVVVSGATSVYGGFKQFTSTATLTKLSAETVTYPAPVEVDLDAWAAAPVIQHVKLTGVLNISGNYYNLNVEGKEAVGTIIAPLNSLTEKLSSGSTVTVYGYAVYASGSTTTYVNIVATQIVVGDSEVDESWIYTIDGIHYKLYNDLTAEVTFDNTSFQRYKGVVNIPSTVLRNGVAYSVTTIGDHAFSGCSNLISIVIPESVKQINSAAFKGCTSLVRAEFASLEGLCGISFEDRLASPLACAHHLYINGELITELVIPKGVTSIGNYAFEGCWDLISVSIPETVRTIGACVFEDCSSLISVIIPTSIRIISEYAFSGCSSLPSITLPGSVKVIKQSAFDGCTSLISAFLSEGLECIENKAFKDCTKLESMFIPESLTSLGERVFEGCVAMSSIDLSCNITSLKDYIFMGCTHLQNVDIPEGVNSIGEGVFQNCTSLTSITIPSGVTLLEKNLCKRCTGLSDLVVNGAVTTWGTDVFPANTLKRVTINGNVAGAPFAGMSNIEEVVVSGDATIIWDRLFAKCTRLRVVSLGSSVKYIKNGAFEGCLRLDTVYSEAVDVPYCYSQAFDDNITQCSLIVSDEAISQYGIAPVWNKFGQILGDMHVLTYTLNGKPYKVEKLRTGEHIYKEQDLTLVGYTFSGWDNLPETMPANDVTVTGSFTINSYTLTYILDGEEYHVDTLEYGSEITPMDAPVREGHTFTGWDSLPKTMPADNVTVEGSYTRNNYTLTYVIGGEVYKVITVEYGGRIAIEKPVREGYTFSGWDNLPETMPANDVIVTGSFTINSYTLTYILDGEEYHVDTLEYGSEITPMDAPVREGHTFTGWESLPKTMPADNVIIIGHYMVNEYWVTYVLDDVVFTSEKLPYGSIIIPPTVPQKDGYEFSWTYIPDTMPAKDIIVYGTYTTGIVDIVNEDEIAAIYTQDGMRIQTLQHGINIIRMNNGTLKKVLIK